MDKFQKASTEKSDSFVSQLNTELDNLRNENQLLKKKNQVEKK